ncbi:TE1 [Symbiodinium pilosum]|uniref:TE1 protein n=1 Tax=Symbiodinium pilosum TaxID=2952 RepID=A0A812QSE2_SYMPI|nr:TE1 [Symbiodinium pilosum]
MQRYRRLRRAMTDSVFLGAFNFNEEETYEAGRFSNERVKAQEEAASTASTAAATPEASRDSTKPTTPVRTTVMLRNIPNNYSREMFLAMLDEQGFAGRYDFVYLPCDFYRQANLGYAFVNLVDAAAVDALWSVFDGFSAWSLPTAKVCQVSWSGPHQGFKAHVERYRNSPVMHRSVPDEYKPVIFKNGARKNFPRPTKKVKAPTAGL